MLSYEREWCRAVRKRYIAEQVVHQPNCTQLVKVIQELRNVDVLLQSDVSYDAQFTALSNAYPEALLQFNSLSLDSVDVAVLAEQKTSKVESQALVTSEIMAAVALAVDVTGNDDRVRESIQASASNYRAVDVIPVQMLYGSISEDKGLRFLDALLAPVGWIEDSNSRQKARFEDVMVQGETVRIYGKIDALYRKDGVALVAENKNRMKRLFPQTPSYDIDQLALYILLWKSDNGLVHQYFNDTGNYTMYSKEAMDSRVQEILTSDALRDSLREIQEYRKLTCGEDVLRKFAEEHLMVDK